MDFESDWDTVATPDASPTMNISEEEEMKREVKRTGFILEEQMADIGIEISTGGIIVDTLGHLKYFTDIKELNDLTESIITMANTFKEAKEKGFVSINKDAFEIFFKLDTLKKCPREIAQKIFEKFVKNAKMGWINCHTCPISYHLI